MNTCPSCGYHRGYHSDDCDRPLPEPMLAPEAELRSDDEWVARLKAEHARPGHLHLGDLLRADEGTHG